LPPLNEGIKIGDLLRHGLRPQPGSRDELARFNAAESAT
jgi:hypothetical protein